MIPRQFPRMVVAETRKVFTSGSAIAALIIAVLVAFGAAGGVWGVGQMQDSMTATMNGENAIPAFSSSAEAVSGWALWARNLYVLPLFLLLATASSIAGELGDRTLRELVVRPVPRWSVLAAKLVALCSLSATTLLLTLVTSVALGAVLYGFAPARSELYALLLGYLATFLSDLGLFALTCLAALLVPSVGGVLVTMVFLLLADSALGLGLMGLTQLGVKEAAIIEPYTLGNALSCWKGFEDGWDPFQFGALGAYVVVSLAFAVARFHRMDVP